MKLSYAELSYLLDAVQTHEECRVYISAMSEHGLGAEGIRILREKLEDAQDKLLWPSTV